MAVLDWLQQSLGGGQYGDPSVPAMSPEPLEGTLRSGGALGQAGLPADGAQGYTADVLQHLKDVISGKVAAGGALAQNNYDPRQSFAQNALNPAAIEQATDIGMGVGPGAIRAWHASPYDFNKFDLSKIGSGQGAASYGRGLYFAESPAVSGPRGSYDLEFTAKNLGKYDLNQGEDHILRLLRGGASDMDVLGELARSGGYTFDEAAAALERVKAAKAKLYEVDIHADPNAFLNWDKPATAQPPNVTDAFGQIWQRAGGTLEGRELPPFTAHKEARGESQYGALSTILSPALASEKLREAGVPGIRYRDQGSRFVGDPVDLQRQIDFARRFADDTDLLPRDRVSWQQRVAELESDLAHAKANPPTHNYVVFDDKLIEIKRKLGLLPPLAAGGLLSAGQSDTP